MRCFFLSRTAARSSSPSPCQISPKSFSLTFPKTPGELVDGLFPSINSADHARRFPPLRAAADILSARHHCLHQGTVDPVTMVVRVSVAHTPGEIQSMKKNPAPLSSLKIAWGSSQISFPCLREQEGDRLTHPGYCSPLQAGKESRSERALRQGTELLCPGLQFRNPSKDLRSAATPRKDRSHPAAVREHSPTSPGPDFWAARSRKGPLVEGRCEDRGSLRQEFEDILRGFSLRGRRNIHPRTKGPEVQKRPFPPAVVSSRAAGPRWRGSMVAACRYALVGPPRAPEHLRRLSFHTSSGIPEAVSNVRCRSSFVRLILVSSKISEDAGPRPKSKRGPGGTE